MIVVRGIKERIHMIYITRPSIRPCIYIITDRGRGEELSLGSVCERRGGCGGDKRPEYSFSDWILRL
jgi:hypothetical protein